MDHIGAFAHSVAGLGLLVVTLPSVSTAQNSPPPAPVKKSSPVKITVSQADSGDANTHRLKIQLDIADEVSIYSQDEENLSFGPFAIKLLDSGKNTIQAKVQYPEAKLVDLNKELGITSRVYTGKKFFVVDYCKKQVPRYVSVTWCGYYPDR